MTPLHTAAMNKSMEPLSFLVESGLDVDALNKKGETALHVACLNNWKEGVEFLLTNGADKSIRTINGLIAEELTEDIEILGLLKKHNT